jgi:hypothetical protein
MESYRASNLLCVPVSHYDQTEIKKDRVAKNIAQRKEYELLLLMKSQQNLISSPSNLTLPTKLTTDFSLLPKLTSSYQLLAPTKLLKMPVNTQDNYQLKNVDQSCNLYIIIFMLFLILLLMIYIKNRNLNKIYY